MTYTLIVYLIASWNTYHDHEIARVKGIQTLNECTIFAKSVKEANNDLKLVCVPEGVVK